MFRVVQTYMRVMIILLGGMFATATSAIAATELDDVSRKEMLERLAPAGVVCEIGQPCADNLGAVASSGNAPRSGEQVYNASCAACHATGLLNSPKKDDSAAWAERLDKVNGDFKTLLAHAINGTSGGMPPKGTCTDCSDEEIQSAIEYMSGLKP
ncbi:c-type cytochrome [Candidatus Sororendozoicomonas aggregata]|uniref:c-type cytochrome n=1 Tax=Candidatus Sororendozoicomonas aggregata TaxID=3073239 RepID=UPI002ED5D168